MFIRYAEFVNFVNFESGLKVHKLVIDLSKQKNPICVIIGDNGKGKTSLLSYLTPFATLGNLDVRNTTKLIIPGEKGFKRIIIVGDDGEEYDIKHHYLPNSKTFTIKSYLELNGKELNENGNVRSFEKLVYELFGLETDYLKLIRMGRNVSNLITSTSTERKVFMAKILEDVNIYLRQYKEIMQKEKETNAVLMHIVDDLTKTDIDDIDSAKKKLKKLEKEIKTVTGQYQEAEQKRAKLLYAIELIAYPRTGDEEIKKLSKTLSEFSVLLDDIKEKNLSLESLENEIRKKGEERAYTKASLDNAAKRHEDLLNELDEQMEELQKLTSAIEKEKDSLNIDSLKEYLVELRKRRNDTHRSIFDEVQLKCTKDEFEDFVVFLKNTQVLLNTTYEFGKEPIKEVLTAMRKNKDIPNLITSSLVLLESRERAERMSIIDRLISKYSVEYSCEDRGCPYMKLYRELMAIKDATPVTEVRQTAEFYQMMKLAYENLSNIFSSFTQYKDIITSLPKEIQDMFTIDALFENIKKGRIIYDESIINEYLSFLTELENYRKIEKELSELEKEIDRLESISKLGYLENQKKSCEEKIEKVRGELEAIDSSLDDIENKILSIEAGLENATKRKMALVEYEGIKKCYDDLVEKKKSSEEKERESEQQTCVCLELKHWKEQLEGELYNLRMNISRFQELTKQLDEQRMIFEDYSNLKYALSNKTGLPLYHIKSYLSKTREIANELLDIVFDGRLYLDPFDITESDFRMPYVKNGKKIADVISASDGEQSFFNMAISSALHVQSGMKYNIALYDEVDGPFDDTNRQKFIPVTEHLMELNNVEQAFLITHNQMFQKYPVDRIDLNCLENSTVDIFYE